jgi:dTDP-glucose 4,6-dehydratase
VSRVLIAGGAGFVGSHLVDRLLDRGDTVVVVDNFTSGRAENLAHRNGDARLSIFEADIVDPLPAEIASGFDAVLNLASPASPPEYLDRPIETLLVGSAGTHRLLELARSEGARFLITSTSEVYGDPLEHPQPESYWGNVNPIGPRSVYDESKRYRRGDHLRLPAYVRVGRPNRPPLQHVRATPAAGRRTGGVELHRPGAERPPPHRVR